MKSIRLPLAVLVVLYISFSGLLLWTMPLFPEHVGSHFGVGGRVNGWMTHSLYAHFIWKLGTILAIAPCALQCIRWIPDRWISRSSEPLEEQREKLDHFLYYPVWMACLCLLAVGGMHYLTLVANRQTPPCLDETGLSAWVAIFLLGIVILLVKMIIPFTKISTKP